MSINPQRLSAEALTAELAKLPAFATKAAVQLDPVRIAIARAIATGQSADQIASDLGLPTAWSSIDFTKPPAMFANKAAAVKPSDAPVALPVITRKPPDWAVKIVPLALAGTLTTRVVVLDREPTALGGMERPAWARALAPSATYGPVSVTDGSSVVSTERWFLVFDFTATVEFTRGSTSLCVLPVSILHLASQTKATGGSIDSGSAWLGLAPFTTVNPAAPANSFAGLTVQSGSLSCDQAFTIGTTIDIPAGATLTLTLVPAPSPAGPANFPATVTPPGTITVTFPPTGTATLTFDSCSATIYGSSVTCNTASSPLGYVSQLNLVAIAGHTTTTQFQPVAGGGGILELSGSAKLFAGWALQVSASTTPLTLGAAANSGAFLVVFESGISALWNGLPEPEAELAGAIVAQNNEILLYTASGEAPGTVIEQVFDLWPDQDSTNNTPCRLVTGRVAGQLLIYARSASSETIQLQASLSALLDRPIYATGARMPAVFLNATIELIHNSAGNRLIVYSAQPAANTTVYPMALDNGFLDVTVPVAIYLTAKTDANFNATSASLLVLMGYLLEQLYLPDPYTGALPAPFYYTSNDPAVGGSATAGAGYLIGEVLWPGGADPTLRLSDAAHTQPALPPSSEASDPPHVWPQPSPLPPAQASPAQAAFAPRDIRSISTVFPGPPNGAVFLDLSTRASQLGVEVTLSPQLDQQYTIDGLSVRGPAKQLPLTTLPSIAWEPMYDHAVTTAGVDPNQLLHPPDDGPMPQVTSLSATLIPISPLQTFANLLYTGPGGFEANFTLPFGITGQLSSTAVKGTPGTVLPNLTLVRPSFPASGTPTGSLYTGAWQLSFQAPDPTSPDPVLAGQTYLRSANDNPDPPTLSYGEQVMGPDVADIFATRFNATNGGVPLLRYDLTGYGASTFSDWTNTTNPAPTDVIKSFFRVLIGRTSHEVIQVQSIICPWGIKVVRTITIDRQASGNVRRYDSGWQAASDGLFSFPAAMEITAQQVHSGVSPGVINVTNIAQIGLPVSTHGTEDSPAPNPPPKAPPAAGIPVQAVTFDANVIIQPQHQVLKGGIEATDLTGGLHTCVPSKGITGYIPLQYGYHLSLQDMVNFPPLAAGSGGPIDATLYLGGTAAKSIVRLIGFDATAVIDNAVAPGGPVYGIVGSVRGLPKLSSDGHWTVAARKQSPASAPAPLPANAGAPVVQPNQSGGTLPGSQVHFADPIDIFRLAPGSTFLPQTLYGFLQATGTQSNFLSRPIVTVGSPNLTLGDALNVAHAGALLGAISSFPGVSNCLNFLNSALTNPITNQLANASLQTTQNLQLTTQVRKTPVPLITTSIADVNLYFYWKGDDPTQPPNPATVVIALGQDDPSWSLDINRVAIGLVIPALSSDPVMWLQGGFHADADTTPTFPNLKVVFDGPLSALTTFFTVLEDIASVLSPGDSGTSQGDGGNDGTGLNVHFSGGTLSVSDNFNLPAIPLGPGTIDNVSLDIGATLNILALNIGFLVSIGTPDTPCHWIVDPLAGTVCIQAGVQNNAIDILIEGGIGLGLSIDLGIASGSASITISVQITINPPIIKLMLLLTGQAQVDVLGGLASAAITITAGLGFSINTSNADIDVIGTASVGIHISICWIISISWSGSWTFEKQLALTA